MRRVFPDFSHALDFTSQKFIADAVEEVGIDIGPKPLEACLKMWMWNHHFILSVSVTARLFGVNQGKKHLSSRVRGVSDM